MHVERFITKSILISPTNNHDLYDLQARSNGGTHFLFIDSITDAYNELALSNSRLSDCFYAVGV